MLPSFLDKLEITTPMVISSGVEKRASLKYYVTFLKTNRK
jgi:hypothetical protein